LGEVVLVLGPQTEPEALSGEETDELIRSCLAHGASVRSVAQQVAQLTEKPRREVYARVLELSRPTLD
jgi:16S rRNA C1402 (ribose-2'-O) methylase RsmI